MHLLSERVTAALRSHLAGEPARPPEGSAILWSIFDGLSRARAWHAHGPNPISFAEIEAYARLMRMPLEPHHVALIREMDQIWISAVQSEVRPGGDKARPTSRAPLTAALFDAMFGGAK